MSVDPNLATAMLRAGIITEDQADRLRAELTAMQAGEWEKLDMPEPQPRRD